MVDTFVLTLTEQELHALQILVIMGAKSDKAGIEHIDACSVLSSKIREAFQNRQKPDPKIENSEAQ